MERMKCNLMYFACPVISTRSEMIPCESSKCYIQLVACRVSDFSFHRLVLILLQNKCD